MRHPSWSRGSSHHLGRMIEWAGRPQGKIVPVLATRIGMLSTRAYQPDQLALKGVDHRHAIHLVGHVGDVPDAFQTMGALEFPRPPGPEEFSLPVKYQHRRIIALGNIAAGVGMR